MQRRRTGGPSCSRCKSRCRHEKKGSGGRRWKRYSISIELMDLPALETMQMGAYSQERREFLKSAFAATSLSFAPNLHRLLVPKKSGQLGIGMPNSGCSFTGDRT